MANMRDKTINELKRAFILFSGIFAVTTIFSSALQLYQGQPTDTNFHILNRAAIVLVAVITIMLFTRTQLKSRVLSYLVPYAISMGVVLLYVRLTGFIEPLHPSAYRDIFLNFMGVAVCITAGLIARDRWMASRAG